MYSMVLQEVADEVTRLRSPRHATKLDALRSQGHLPMLALHLAMYDVDHAIVKGDDPAEVAAACILLAADLVAVAAKACELVAEAQQEAPWPQSG